MFSAKRHGYIDLDMEQIPEGQGQKKYVYFLCLFVDYLLTYLLVQLNICLIHLCL